MKSNRRGSTYRLLRCRALPMFTLGYLSPITRVIRAHVCPENAVNFKINKLCPGKSNHWIMEAVDILIQSNSSPCWSKHPRSLIKKRYRSLSNSISSIPNSKLLASWWCCCLTHWQQLDCWHFQKWSQTASKLAGQKGNRVVDHDAFDALPTLRSNWV
jgi:hypothetical protein